MMRQQATPLAECFGQGMRESSTASSPLQSELAEQVTSAQALLHLRSAAVSNRGLAETNMRDRDNSHCLYTQDNSAREYAATATKHSGIASDMISFTNDGLVSEVDVAAFFPLVVPMPSLTEVPFRFSLASRLNPALVHYLQNQATHGHPTIPLVQCPTVIAHSLPFCLSHPSDVDHLSRFQVFLRLHIEAFAATPEECTTTTRGRTKRVQVGQVGIRCRHCAKVSHARRTKGAVYFPVSTMGFYQAAQNMSSSHLQCGACPEMSASIESLFTELMATKTTKNSSMRGRSYWSQCVEQMGLVDTELGVFSRDSIPNGVRHLVTRG